MKQNGAFNVRHLLGKTDKKIPLVKSRQLVPLRCQSAPYAPIVKNSIKEYFLLLSIILGVCIHREVR